MCQIKAALCGNFEWMPSAAITAWSQAGKQLTEVTQDTFRHFGAWFQRHCRSAAGEYMDPSAWKGRLEMTNVGSAK